MSIDRQFASLLSTGVWLMMSTWMTALAVEILQVSIDPEVSYQTIGHVGNGARCHHFFNLIFPFAALNSFYLGNESQIFRNNHIGIKRSSFGKISDVSLHRQRLFRYVITIHQSFPPGRRKETREDSHGGSLS